MHTRDSMTPKQENSEITKPQDLESRAKILPYSSIIYMIFEYGTAELVSRDQILRCERGQGKVHFFPCSADHEQDWQPCPVDPYSAIICDDHTCIRLYCTPILIVM